VHQDLKANNQPTSVGSSQAIYTLGLGGVEIVVKNNNVDAKVVKNRRRLDRILKYHSIEHNLRLNDFHIKLNNLSRSIPQIQFRNWLDARDCECRYKYLDNGKEIKTSLRPDGYFELLYRKVMFPFFVELDMSTSNHAKLKAKFNSYVTFQDKKIYQKIFNRDSFYVLFITNSSRRLLNLHKIASKIQIGRFWFIDFNGTEKNLFFDEIWLPSGMSKPRSFFQTPKVRLVS